MRKVIVFKHVAQENLGQILPVLKREAFRIRYVNFQREPEAWPSMERYQGLIVLGGWMGVYEMDSYPHLKAECKLVEEALKRGIPILGICLGSQILAHVLGATVRRHSERETGWCEIHTSKEGQADPMLQHFGEKSTVFQMHGDTFDLPAGASLLARSEKCESQAFRYGERAYGLQFHLEVNQAMIQRFLENAENQTELLEFAGPHTLRDLKENTPIHLPHSQRMAEKSFAYYLSLFQLPERSKLTRTIGHGKE